MNTGTSKPKVDDISRVFGEPKERGLHGSDVIWRLQHGHVVRRAAWVDGIFARVCNDDEILYDEAGIIRPRERDSLYVHSTRGLFAHTGYSPQPKRAPRVYERPGFEPEVAWRAGEGMTELFMSDWEDYGFVGPAAFLIITDAVKDLVAAEIIRVNELAIEAYKRERGHVD